MEKSKEKIGESYFKKQICLYLTFGASLFISPWVHGSPSVILVINLENNVGWLRYPKILIKIRKGNIV